MKVTIEVEAPEGATHYASSGNHKHLHFGKMEADEWSLWDPMIGWLPVRGHLVKLCQESMLPIVPTAPAMDWKWFAGQDEEIYQLGPFDSREEALEAGKAEWWDNVHIVEAQLRFLDLADAIDAEDIIERWFDDDDSMTGPIDMEGEPIFDLTSEQEQELSRDLIAAARRFGTRHGLDKVNLFWFASMRNCAMYQRDGEELVHVPDPA